MERNCKILVNAAGLVEILLNPLVIQAPDADCANEILAVFYILEMKISNGMAGLLDLMANVLLLCKYKE